VVKRSSARSQLKTRGFRIRVSCKNARREVSVLLCFSMMNECPQKKCAQNDNSMFYWLFGNVRICVDDGSLILYHRKYSLSLRWGNERVWHWALVLRSMSWTVMRRNTGTSIARILEALKWVMLSHACSTAMRYCEKALVVLPADTGTSTGTGSLASFILHKSREANNSFSFQRWVYSLNETNTVVVKQQADANDGRQRR